MKRLLKALSIAALLVSSILTQSIWADTGTGNASLEQRLDDLEQQVAILKRQIENNKEDTKSSASTTPIVSANSKDGFSIKSPDGSYSLKIGGYVQAEAREFASNNKEELDEDTVFQEYHTRRDGWSAHHSSCGRNLRLRC